MEVLRVRRLVLSVVFFSLTILGVTGGMADSVFAGDKGIKGWEKGSEYDKLYNPKERDSIKGRVVKFKTPLAMTCWCVVSNK